MSDANTGGTEHVARPTRVEDAEDPDPPRSSVAPSEADTGAVVDIIDPERLFADADGLRGLVERAMRALDARGEVRVKLAGHEEMARVHLEYCGVPGTTDVVTFDLADGGSAPDPDTGEAREPLDVDLVVCVDEARAQAAARSIPVEHELLLYVLHGVLHCLGEDDQTDDAFDRMHAREDAVLRELGIGPVFHTDRGGES